MPPHKLSPAAPGRCSVRRPAGATGAPGRRSQGRARIAACLAGLALLLFATGCGMIMRPQPAPPPPRPVEQSLEQRAAAAWETGNYAESLRLYRDLLQRPAALPRQQLGQAWERMVLSALENRQYHLALESMPKWRRAVPGVVDSETWQDAYFRALKNIGDTGLQETELLALSSDDSLPWRMRARAGIELAALHWKRGDVRRPQMILSLVHQQATQLGQNSLATIEGMLLNALPPVPLEHLEAFEMLIPEEDRMAFPYTIVQLEKARRLAARPGTRNQAYTLVQRVAPFLADRSLVKKVLEGDTARPEPGDRSVALALPLTGPYGEVASKILRGAMAAQKNLADEGTEVDVRVVNTDGGAWQQELADLPPQTTVVGGPLRVDIFKQLMATQLPRQRAFFAFLAGLGSANEGQDAWRFFTSADDQVRTLVDAATSNFNVSSTAVLYPEDSYGMHMAQLFRQEAMGQRLAVNASESYPPRNTEAWNQIVARIANSGAGAVFIPGDWDHAEQLAPWLPYHDAGDMLLMGPSLWGPSIDRKGYVEISSFAKAIFPGAWWPENDTPAAMALKRRLADEGQPLPDFWTALGYDFVRFAATMDMQQSWTPAAVTESARQAQLMSWSQAPIRWDQQGRAAQQLFPLRLTQGGYTLLAPQAAPAQPAAPALQQPQGAPQALPPRQPAPAPQEGQRYAVPPAQPQYAPSENNTVY